MFFPDEPKWAKLGGCFSCTHLSISAKWRENVTSRLKVVEVRFSRSARLVWFLSVLVAGAFQNGSLEVRQLARPLTECHFLCGREKWHRFDRQILRFFCAHLPLRKWCSRTGFTSGTMLFSFTMTGASLVRESIDKISFTWSVGSEPFPYLMKTISPS